MFKSFNLLKSRL